MQRIPKESEEQASLFEWAQYQAGKYPELELMYHVPNGGSRNKIEAANLKRQGVKPGVPDVCLPVPRGGNHGAYIELKRIKGGRISPDQAEWMDRLMNQGYAVACCKGWQDAAKFILEYLSQEKVV